MDMLAGAATRMNRRTHLVSPNQWRLGWNWPVTFGGVEVGVADTGALELDETFARLEVGGLWDGLVVDDLERRAGVANDGGLHRLGDLEGRGAHPPEVWEGHPRLQRRPRREQACCLDAAQARPTYDWPTRGRVDPLWGSCAET